MLRCAVLLCCAAVLCRAEHEHRSRCWARKPCPTGRCLLRPGCPRPRAGWPSTLFFISWVTIGKWIILTLFLAITLAAFEQSYDKVARTTTGGGSRGNAARCSALRTWLGGLSGTLAACLKPCIAQRHVTALNHVCLFHAGSIAKALGVLSSLQQKLLSCCGCCCGRWRRRRREQPGAEQDGSSALWKWNAASAQVQVDAAAVDDALPSLSGAAAKTVVTWLDQGAAPAVLLRLASKKAPPPGGGQAAAHAAASQEQEQGGLIKAALLQQAGGDTLDCWPPGGSSPEQQSTPLEPPQQGGECGHVPGLVQYFEQRLSPGKVAPGPPQQPQEQQQEEQLQEQHVKQEQAGPAADSVAAAPDSQDVVSGPALPHPAALAPDQALMDELAACYGSSLAPSRRSLEKRLARSRHAWFAAAVPEGDEDESSQCSPAEHVAPAAAAWGASGDGGGSSAAGQGSGGQSGAARSGRSSVGGLVSVSARKPGPRRQGTDQLLAAELQEADGASECSGMSGTSAGGWAALACQRWSYWIPEQI